LSDHANIVNYAHVAQRLRMLEPPTLNHQLLVSSGGRYVPRRVTAFTSADFAATSYLLHFNPVTLAPQYDQVQDLPFSPAADHDIAFVTSHVTITSTTSWTDVTGFSLTFPAGEKWVFYGTVAREFHFTPDALIRFVNSGTAEDDGEWWHYGDRNHVPTADTDFSTSVGKFLLGVTGTQPLLVGGWIDTAAGGSATVKLQFKQLASDPNNTRVRVGSHLIGRRVG
jgi:hypothetical protein